MVTPGLLATRVRQTTEETTHVRQSTGEAIRVRRMMKGTVQGNSRLCSKCVLFFFSNVDVLLTYTYPITQLRQVCFTGRQEAIVLKVKLKISL